MLIYYFKWTWRELSKFIKPLLYKWIIKEVIRENYISRIYLQDKKIKKEHIKKVYFISDNEKQLKQIIEKNQLFKPV